MVSHVARLLIRSRRFSLMELQRRVISEQALYCDYYIYVILLIKLDRRFRFRRNLTTLEKKTRFRVAIHGRIEQQWQRAHTAQAVLAFSRAARLP